MNCATIYDLDGHTIADGVYTAATVPEAAMIAAREAARDRNRSVVVEDYGTRECYRVTPSGRRWKRPQDWPAPHWELRDGDDDR